MSKRIPTRVELHRLKYHWSGRKIRPIPFDRLDPEEKGIVARDILSNVYINRCDPYRAYADVLSSWGLACSHPQHMRNYPGIGKSHFPLFQHRWYDCNICGCTVVNEDFCHSRKTG